MVGPATPPNLKFPLPFIGVGPTSAHLITTAASLRLGSFLRHRLHLHFLHHSPLFKNTSSLFHMHELKDVLHRTAFQFSDTTFSLWSSDVFSAAYASLFFFHGDGSQNNDSGIGKMNSKKPRGLTIRRQWTNVIIAMNVLVYIAQFASQGKLLLLGAKVNSLINRGELWRLVTSAFLHANIGHLMVNCYSLNSIGPLVENLCGPQRYLAIYLSSAIASSSMSYWFCKGPAVGASGAIFGLVGSFAVYVLRHRGVVKGADQDIQYIARVILLNMAIGLLSKGIDNWGHLGGLIGGVGISFLLGPAWELEYISEGKRVYTDKAPIFTLIKKNRNLKS